MVAAMVWAGAASLGQATGAVEPAGVEALRREAGPAIEVRLHPVTGVARNVHLEPGRPPLRGAGPEERGEDFLRRFGAAFGIERPEDELSPAGSWSDGLGHTHLTYRQTYRGLPVFGAELRLHFDAAGSLRVVQGTFLPNLALDPVPSVGAGAAAAVATDQVRRQAGAEAGAGIDAREPRLLVFREGLLRRVPGADRLAWEVEVGDGGALREFVYVDATSGRVLDQIHGIHTLLRRRVHEPEYNNAVIWTEGNALPYASGDPPGDAQVNTLIQTARNVYDLFKNLSGGTYLSWDGASGFLHGVWNIPPGPGSIFCPNAYWNGVSANFCDGVASDDTAAHEWTHGYTEHTSGLIYQWQSGALSEAASDTFGELVDMLNGLGTDAPAGARAPAGCSGFGGAVPPTLLFHSPAALAGSVAGGDADFNPAAPVAVTADVALANDAVGATADGCEPLVGFPAGRLALLDRYGCIDTDRVKRAQDAGASGAIVVNPLGPGAFRMSGVDPAIHIPAIMVGNADGDSIKAQLGAGVNATLSLAVAGDGSLRWLIGEDNPGYGPIRDLWNPTCFQNPGRISDRSFYTCSDADGGGVHTNSGVPSHAFALLLDGGAFNGQTVSALGTTRVASLYWRAMSVYQVPDTDFADHADALEQACADLKGANLPDPATGLPSGLTFANANCNEVADALLAVELRSAPAFCDFQPLLNPATPALTCGAPAFLDDLESDPSLSWTRTHTGGVLSCTPQQWEWAAPPPAGGSGHALFASDPIQAEDCPPTPGLAFALFADTPAFLLRAASPVLTFDHYVATEARLDGGNVMASVNGGPFGVLPSAAFRFNPYNLTLETAAAGNTNPLAGQPAFSGTNSGESQGSWGQSQVDLGTLAGPGDTLRLRFQFGADSAHGLVGWYVDNVRVCGDCAGAAGADTDADGFRPCDGDCDDGVAATHPGAGETNDGLDNECPGEEGRGLVDEIGPTAGFFDGADLALFSWGAQSGAVQYEVARAATAGFSTDCTTFLTPTASLVDPASPASRATWFYLVRASAPNVGTFGVHSSGALRTVPCAP